jgi:membrane protease YdiL (CAAX protease family)
MTAIDATMWTVLSVLLLGAAFAAVNMVRPALIRDRGALALIQLTVYAALLVLMRRLHFPHTDARVVFGTRPGRWVHYPIAALLGVAIQVPTGALYEAILARWPTDSLSSSLAEAFTTLPMWRKVTAGVGLLLTTPLIEETFFRGALFGTLRRQHGAAAVVVVTTVLFALIHLQPQALVPIAMVGAALAFLRVASGSMWPGVVLHTTYNAVTFWAIASGAAERPDADEPWPPWLVLAGTVVTAGLLALADYFRAKDKQAAPAAPEEQS